MIHETRIQVLNREKPRKGRYVLYWMQAACRASCNHALEYAVRRANELGQPLLACFGLLRGYPGANARHYAFLLEGLRETQESLERRGMRLIVRRGVPDAIARELGRDASLVVTDRGYLRHQRAWRERAAEALACPLIQVESDVVVPADAVSGKEEYAAATIRRKIHPLLETYLKPLEETPLGKDSLGLSYDSLPLGDIPALLKALGADRAVPPAPGLWGGTSEARRRLREFLDKKLARYHEERNDPALDAQSGLSPYLHFGQIAPLEIALALGRRRGAGRDAFLEELIVRRELGVNFVLRNPRYDDFKCLPEWCRETLGEHERDRREYVYSAEELDAARTHDPYWNAAQREMVLTGKMHGYMRMYWGKKILEWTERPEEGFRLALRLNDRYELDGRDPNGYAGVAWCFGKHDRPWAERPVFGKVRYMNANGLRRKFDADAYVRRVEALEP